MYMFSDIAIPIVEHCNLNCKGCLHFCHKGQTPYYYDIDRFRMDIKKLHLYFKEIGSVRLYGGEPLLHNQLGEFIKVIRKYYPKSELKLLTNGLLITRIQPTLIAALKKYQVKIYWSVYPIITTEEYAETIRFMDRHGLHYSVNYINEFCAFYEPNGNIDPQYAYKRCSGKYCHVMRNGKISCCPAPLVGHLINELGGNIDFSDSVLDLYGETSAEEILDFLSKPHPVCKYCTVPRYFAWQQQNENYSLDDWKC